MAWLTHSSATAFDTAAGAFLTSRPVAHSVPLTIAQRARRAGPGGTGSEDPQDGGPPAEFGHWTAPDGAVAAAWVRTPPRGLLLTDLPGTSARELALLWAARDPALPGATGPQAAVTAFAAAWRDVTGRDVNSARSKPLYRLGDLTEPPPGPRCAGRTAGADDAALLGAWWGAFGGEIGEGGRRTAPGPVAERLAFGGLSVWEDGGTPVSFAGRTRTAGGTARIAPVYTPPPLRGRGYAAGATAHACRAALAAGAQQVVLFTDGGNATSNRLYRRLGFHRVGTHLTVGFAAA
jgi:ribosomal protein S18 acetylase RimI-like enzyme